jgi:4-amino-4-deoxy-L-arabinose transferase-like glycosyltransferase
MNRKTRALTSAAWIVPLIMLMLAAGARFYRLDTQSLWNDEGNSLRLAQRGVSDLVDAAGRDIHPPGYYLVLKAWITLGGESEFSLRALSAFEGMLAVAVILTLGRVLFSPLAGWIAGGIAALHPLAIYYSQETRMYAQLSLLSGLSMLLLVMWLRRQRVAVRPIRAQQAAPLLALVLCNAAGMYTHYSYAFTLAAQVIVFLVWFISRTLWTWRVRALSVLYAALLGGVIVSAAYHFLYSRISPDVMPLIWLAVLLMSFVQRRAANLMFVYVWANLFTLMLLLPWLPTAYDQITTWPRTGIDLALDEQLRVIFTWITVGNTAGSVEWLRFAGPGVLIGPALWPDQRTNTLPRWWRVMLPLCWLIIVIAALLASGAYREANLKFLLPAQSAAALLIGAGGARVWESYATTKKELGAASLPMKKDRRLPVVGRGMILAQLLSLAALALVIYGQSAALDRLYHDPAYARADYRSIAAAILSDPRPGDAVILDAPNQAEVFTYYYRGDAPIYALPRGLGGDDERTRADVEAVIQDHQRIFVVFWGEQERDPNRVVQTTLDTGAYPVLSRWYGDVRLAQYAVLSDTAAAPQVDTDARFGDSISLLGYALSADSARPGDVIGVTLFWTTSARLEHRYKVTVQLLNPDGSLAAQHDAEPGGNRALTTTWPPGETIPDLHGLIIPPDLLPGSYSLIVGLYNVDNPADRLSAVQHGTALGDHLLLTNLTLSE